MTEEPLRKTLDAAVSVATSRPIKHCKNCRHSDRVDLFALHDERGIVLRLKLARGIVVREGVRERDRDQVKA
jgi:hypothetical protein